MQNVLSKIQNLLSTIQNVLSKIETFLSKIENQKSEPKLNFLILSSAFNPPSKQINIDF